MAEKKVYIKNLSVEEITSRLKKGETIYNVNDDFFYKDINGYITRYEKGKPTDIGEYITICEDYYFLDEVEEPEADESCIGKLCYFWNEEDDEKEIGFLGEIDKEHNFPFAMGFGYSGVGYKHCRALTKEEVMKYIKE